MILRISEVGNFDIYVNVETSRVSIGCQTLTVEEWFQQGEAIGKDAGLTYYEISQYKRALELVQAALQPRPASTVKKSAKKSENKLAKKKAAKQVKHVTKKAVAKKAVTKKRK